MAPEHQKGCLKGSNLLLEDLFKCDYKVTIKKAQFCHQQVKYLRFHRTQGEQRLRTTKKELTKPLGYLRLTGRFESSWKQVLLALDPKLCCYLKAPPRSHKGEGVKRNPQFGVLSNCQLSPNSKINCSLSQPWDFQTAQSPSFLLSPKDS